MGKFGGKMERVKKLVKICQNLSSEFSQQELLKSPSWTVSVDLSVPGVLFSSNQHYLFYPYLPILSQ